MNRITHGTDGSNNAQVPRVTRINKNAVLESFDGLLITLASIVVHSFVRYFSKYCPVRETNDNDRYEHEKMHQGRA